MQNPRRTELLRGQWQPPWLQSSVESVQSVVTSYLRFLLYLAKPPADLLNPMRCHTEGQHENDDITDRTREQAVPSCSEANLRSYLVTPIKLISTFLGNLNPSDESTPPDLPHVYQIFYPAKPFSEVFDLRLQLLKYPLLFKNR